MQVTLLKNGDIYTPESIGITDILIVDGKIAAIAPSLELPACFPEATVIDAAGHKVIPGLIDAHVHITGGGGEGSFHTQVPPIQLSTIVSAGITTVGGLLGTDGTTRTPESVYSKACSLEEEGISAFMVTGGYPLPSPTITGAVQKDIAFLNKIRGGKVAIADHRASPLTVSQLAALATEVRVGGMLSGLIGMLIVHIGPNPDGLKLILDVIEEYPYLARHLIATHINRNPSCFAQAMQLANNGGFLDISSGLNAQNLGVTTIKPSRAIVEALDAGVHEEHILMSSDGNGSAASYGEDGEVVGLVAADIGSLFEEFRDAVLVEGLSFETALRVVTSNVAKAFSLYPMKGSISLSADADLVLLDDEMQIDTVIARGQLMVENSQVIVKGTFER